MSSSSGASQGPRLLRLWNRLSGLPGGRHLFMLLLYRSVPYSGTTRARVVHLEPGRVRIRLEDRRRVRNHLGSIHAVALANIGELASGLAMLTALPPSVRGIVTDLEAEYRKKARGPVVAECRCRPPDVGPDPVEHVVSADLVDAAGDKVARVRVTWRLAPVERDPPDAGAP